MSHSLLATNIRGFWPTECFQSNLSQYWKIKWFHMLIKISISLEKSENIATLLSGTHWAHTLAAVLIRREVLARSPGAHSGGRELCYWGIDWGRAEMTGTSYITPQSTCTPHGVSSQRGPESTTVKHCLGSGESYWLPVCPPGVCLGFQRLFSLELVLFPSCRHCTHPWQPGQLIPASFSQHLFRLDANIHSQLIMDQYLLFQQFLVAYNLSIVQGAEAVTSSLSPAQRRP